MYISQKIDIKLYMGGIKLLYEKSYIYAICIKVEVLNRLYSTNTQNNLKTTISHRNLRISGLLLL